MYYDDDISFVSPENPSAEFSKGKNMQADNIKL